MKWFVFSNSVLNKSNLSNFIYNILIIVYSKSKFINGKLKCSNVYTI